MSTEDNKAIYRRFIEEGFNKGNLPVLDEVLAQNYVLHDVAPGADPGPAGVKEVISMFRAAFPDLQIVIEEQVAEGDKVTSRTTMRGTHKGNLFGIPATNKTVAVPGLTMVSVKDGKITESWVRNDAQIMFAQLGVSPPTS